MPVGAQRVGERVGALVDLAEGERAELVDDRRLVREVARRGRVAGGGRRAVAQQRARGVPEAVRALGVHDARARERDQRVQLRLGLGRELTGRRESVASADSPIWTAAAYPVGPRPSRSAGGSRPPGAG